MKHKITIEFDDEANSLGCGFRQEWLSGSDDKVQFDLTSGAGCGTPWLIFGISQKNGKGKVVHAVADIRAVVDQLVEALRGRVGA